MPLWSLTIEKVEELLKNKDNKVHEIEILTNTTEAQLWDNDIDSFLKVLDEVEAIEEAERQSGKRLRKGAGNNKKAGKVKNKKSMDVDSVSDSTYKEKKPPKGQSTLNPFVSEKKEKAEKTEKPIDTSKLGLKERLALKSIII